MRISPRCKLSKWRLSLAVALLLSLFASPALAEPTVKVRVEGESSTLLALTEVALETPEPVSGCPANSANAAINLAVRGNWDHGVSHGSKGDFTQTILGETHEFTHEADTWAVWINDKWGGGICEDLLSTGDEVLLIADHEPEPSFAPRVLPLVISGAPTSATAGVSFSVIVNKIHTRAGSFAQVGEGTPVPEPGAVVAAGAYTATSDPNGLATLTIPVAGVYALSAHKPGDAPAAPVPICVRASGESGCGRSVSNPSSSSGVQTTLSASLLPVAPYKGPYALVAKVTALIDGHVYRRGRAPRTLEGTVLAHSAVSSVSLELRRSFEGRCYAFDGTAARFVRARCGRGRFLHVSSNGLFSYLLPAELPRGRYVLDVEASDIAGNQLLLARGTSRIVFFVR